jgi:phospholipid/cholesterol/gamma-HCH transport system permease protein
MSAGTSNGRTVPRAAGVAEWRSGLEQSRVYESVDDGGRAGALAVRVISEVVRPPFSWFPQAIEETATIFRRCLIPTIVSMTVWLIGVEVIVFGNLLKNLGVTDRFAGGAGLGVLREPATWIAMMVFAGVAGGAATADLGARKAREELDALNVLAVDVVKLLVVPRVMAMTFAAVILAMVAWLDANVVNYLLSPGPLNYSRGIFGPGLKITILSVDIYASIVKTVLMGFFIGVVACHRGLTCKTGAEGVGRAVNQTVVITFFGVWLMNSFFNLTFLTLFPDASVFRG